MKRFEPPIFSKIMQSLYEKIKFGNAFAMHQGFCISKAPLLTYIHNTNDINVNPAVKQMQANK